MYDHQHALTVRAEHEIAIAEATRVIAHMPERHIRPGRVIRLRDWIASRHQRRQRVVSGQQTGTVRPSFVGDSNNV